MDSGVTNAASEIRLRQFLEDESDSLLRTLRVYVARAGLAEGEVGVRSVATDLLSEVTLEALAHADRFDAARAPMAWLLGIAANLIQRRKVERAKLDLREPLVRDLVDDPQDVFSEEDLFDRLATLSTGDVSKTIEEDEVLAEYLSHLTPADRNVLRLAVLDDLDGERLAIELGTTPGTARVRLHRAIRRLREVIGEGRVMQ